MKSLKHLILAATLCLAVGCLNVPKTLIKGDMNKGTFEIAAPKDGTLEGFQLTRLTNGALQITIQKHTVRMNPDVIQQTAAGQAQLIQATSAGIGGALGDAFSKILANYGVKAGTAPPAPVPTVASTPDK